MPRRWTLVVLILTATVSMATAADSKDPLIRARALYNSRQFDSAIVAADDARTIPTLAGRADLIAARAYLERYQDGKADIDLSNARDRLRRISAAHFSVNERLEYTVGLGEALYFSGASGAAALVFSAVLDGSSAAPGVSLSGLARERIVDWWATALDRDAQPRPDIERQGIYQRIRDRMAVELARDSGNVAALYWMVSASRSQGDGQAAWDAAQAAWAWAPITLERAATLRRDLDELVTRGIIPDRARRLGIPAESLMADWDAFKRIWTTP